MSAAVLRARVVLRLGEHKGLRCAHGVRDERPLLSVLVREPGDRSARESRGLRRVDEKVLEGAIVLLCCALEAFEIGTKKVSMVLAKSINGPSNSA